MSSESKGIAQKVRKLVRFLEPDPREHIDAKIDQKEKRLGELEQERRRLARLSHMVEVKRGGRVKHL